MGQAGETEKIEITSEMIEAGAVWVAENREVIEEGGDGDLESLIVEIVRFYRKSR